MQISNVIITIDAEVGEKAKNVIEGYERFMLGRIGDTEYGVSKIVELLENHGFSAEFFLDVYEYERFGEERFIELCSMLLDKDQGIQLHTHPSYLYDVNRRNMHDYNSEEQIRIISEGREKLHEWTGIYPLAHRAGNYGADDNTLKALEKNKIPIDSSYYHEHENCKMNIDTINEPIYHGNVLEFPITVTRYSPKIKGIPVPFKKMWLKLDINALEFSELTKALQSIIGDNKYLILFLHSSSFVKRDETGTEIAGIDERALTSFKGILEFFDQNREIFRVRTFDKCYEDFERAK